jgi:nucleoporin NUP2
VLGANPHDEEGEGEEEEETIHGIKSKAYRMKKADEKGGVGWVEIGYGESCISCVSPESN